MNLFDLTNQPTGLILGEYAGTPLYSVEDNYTYQYNGNGIIQRTSSGVETIKYSTDLASTEPNNIYQVTFDISLSQQPDTLGTESKIEFQTTIDNSIGVTFFELSYDDLIQLNVGNQSTTFTTQYTATLSGESILQIKSTEVGFFIQNIQVENLGVEEPDEEILDEGASTESLYVRACLCDGAAANAYGGFKEDFEQWVDDSEYTEEEGFELYVLGYSEIPEGVYPSNCIGSMLASDQLQARYDDVDVSIFHDPQLCVFGGMELNPDKKNLIGLTWSDFAAAIESDNIFGLSPGLTEVEMTYMFFNKSGNSLINGTTSKYDMSVEENEDLIIKLAYNFNAEKTNEYNPPLKFYNTGGADEYDDATWPYKSFSYTYNPNLGIDNPDGYKNSQDINFEEMPPPPTWEGEKYTTSENIYPIYGYGSNKPDVDDNVPVFVSEWDGKSSVVGEDEAGEVWETIFPGKCPAQFVGEQDLDGKFGRQTLRGFGPTMCHDSHFDKILEDWLENDDKSNPKIRPSQAPPEATIETNPDANNVEIPIYANFPDNPTYNFIKTAFDNKMVEILGESPYTKFITIKIYQEDIRHFATVSYVDNNDEIIQSFDLSQDDSNISYTFEITDMIPAVVDKQIGPHTYREQYGKILFTPAEAPFDVETSIEWNLTHKFVPGEVQNQIYDYYYKGPTYNEDEDSYPNGYDGIKIYNYGNLWEYRDVLAASNPEAWYNSHFTQIWSISSPWWDTTSEDQFDEGHYVIQWPSPTISVTNQHFPDYYWGYEFDEQRGIQPSHSYPNSWHWSDNYSLHARYSEFNHSYWKYDNPTLSTYSQLDLNILQLYDYSFADGWINDNAEGGTAQNTEVLSHTPWPEQVIESWESWFKESMDYDDNVVTGNIFQDFDGVMNAFQTQNIYVTGTVQYSGDFGVPGFDIDLNPSLDKSYDPYSGIDLRPEIIDENICQHIELMVREGSPFNGDNIFYKASEHPEAGDFSSELTCDDIFNDNLTSFTKIRARCGDGSVVLMADGMNDAINYPEDFFHYSGIDACKYASNNIRSYPNNEKFHFGADLDKRPSLGLFYYEEDNQASENFTGNLGDEFLQYPNTNLVTNPDGSVVDKYLEKTLFQGADDTIPYTWSWFKPAGGWRPTDKLVHGYLDHVAYDGGDQDWGDAGFNYFPKYFIQSDDFDSSLGFYRLAGWESFGGGPDSYEDFQDNFRGRYFNGWIFENTYYTHYYFGGLMNEYGPFRRTDYAEDDNGENNVPVGRHPYCHSAGKCLNFQLHPKVQDGVDVTDESTPREEYLSAVQRLLTKEEATQLFYHDTQSMPDLKVSFWMYTSSEGVEDLDEPHFPEIEVGVTKNNLISPPSDTSLSLYGDLNSLSNNGYIGASGRFKNTVLDEWERFEFTFNLYYDHFYDNNNKEFYPLFLSVQWSGYEIKDIHADTQEERYSKYAYGSVYLDDFSVKETGEFIPDVDVRAKKGEGNYGVGSLMEYYDPMIENQLESYNDTTAPLEAQFYFYARFFNEQVFDREDLLEDRFGNNATFRSELIANDFRRGRFYLYDVDFGDGSEKEFTDKPLRLGNDVAVYHTYTKSGIYDITGYMLRTRPTKNEDGTPNHDEPSGVLHNKKFTVRINVNEGLDEDFTYFGSEEGFSYLPYKNISPVIGGVSQESSYYKAIKRQLGFISDDDKTSIFFEKQSDKLKTEIALSKMDSSLNNDFEILPEFQIPRYSEPDGGGELIYGGITTIEDELGKTLGNVDLTNVRFFNEPKEIYQMFGFTCDNDSSDVDLIPLGKPEYGLNYSKHSRTFTNRDDIKSPYFTNVSKIANQYENGNLIKDVNTIRFGHDFRIDNIEGLGSGQWNHIDNHFVDTPAFNTPDLGYNQTYTYSTHIYIPFGYCEDGRPCSEEENQYTVMCSECDGAQQYDEGFDFRVNIVQNMNDPMMGRNDWVHDLWHADIVGGEFGNTHQLPTSETPGNKTSFKYKQFDAFNHCHPKGVNNQRFKYGWDNGEVYPIRDSVHCSEFSYSDCGLENANEDVAGCYWDGDENSGTCKAANLIFNQAPFNRTCWQATTEGECEDGCEWYGDGSNNASFETPITISHEEIITDEWFRLDFPFTTKEPSEYGNHISLRFDTHLGVNRTTDYYENVSYDVITNGTFSDPTNDISDEYLLGLPSPTCFEEYDIAGQDGILNVTDRQIWYNPQSDGAYGRPDISTKIIELILADDTVEAAGGYCPNGYDGIDYEIFRNPTIGDWVLLGWNLFGDVVYSNREVKINFRDSFAEVTQEHEYDDNTYERMYKLEYEVVEATTGLDSKLLIVASPAGYVVEESIELPTNTIGVQEVIFTSDNSSQSVEDPEDPDRDDTGDNQNQEGDSRIFFPRTLIIGHEGGFDASDSVRIDNVKLYEVNKIEQNTTTKYDGLYTFGAQLLAGDFSGDDLINYTSEDLNPGDCVDFESGNPSSPRYWKNIIPKFYQFYYRDGLSDYDPDGRGNLFPTPALVDGSDVWKTEFADVDVLYKSNEDKLIVRVIDGDNQNNGGDGEKLPLRNKFVGILDHITQDSGCDGYTSCLNFMANQTDNLAAWYQFKFTYYGTETDLGGESDNSLGGVGIGFGRMIYLRADDWDKETEGPMDGTKITSEPGHNGELWIYGGDYDGDMGDGNNDYPNQPHPDFWEKANCVVGEECTVWIMWEGDSPDYGTWPSEAGISLYNGQNYDETTWGGFSLTRGDEAVGLALDVGLRFEANYTTEQEWIGTNEYGNTYYYPVLPRFGFNGTFESANNQFYPGGDYDYPNDNIPFPIEAMVTEEIPQDQSMIINIYNDQDEPNVFTDGSGNDNNAFAINDYKPKYNEKTSEPQSIKNVNKIRTSKDRGAF